MNYLEEIDWQAPAFADFYDELPLWSARFGLTLLDHVELRPGMTVLDVGAGTGFLSIELAQRCGPTTKVIAVDPWEAAIARLNRKLEYFGIKNVRTIVQDVSALDLPAESVDLVVSNLGINNFDMPEDALRACFRVAKPGAKLWLTSNLVGHMSEFYEAYRSVLSERGFTDRLAVLDAHIHHRATVDSTRSLLERAGFESVEAVIWSFRERFVDGSALLNHHFIRLGFVPAWKSIAPERAIVATFQALERHLNSIAAQQGELSLTIPCACMSARKPAAN